MDDRDFEVLEEEIAIDEYDLENELTSQVENYYQVSRNYRHAIDMRDTAKKSLSETRSQAFFDAREKLLEKEGKATEAMINAEIELMEEVQDAHQEYLDAQSQLNQWAALKDSYDQRSYALNKLVDLYISGYFGQSPAMSAKEKQNEEKERKRQERYRRGREQKKQNRKS